MSACGKALGVQSSFDKHIFVLRDHSVITYDLLFLIRGIHTEPSFCGIYVETFFVEHILKRHV